ncbi:flavin reductase family protein [Marinivivus vitaminiproducens]|uniref:flavin reductase family protein n=1 Tax=Marinivivus vitaminiproducens TaxID=3035935 RepID=UPI0027A78FDF|nr:flavin reductase family protein [Geminicoccaceae bacterium SCSIO 64248]
MFYDPRANDHGLPHNPFKAVVVPRPIGWISTLSPDGRPNLAPFSFFNAVAERPPIVMFSAGGKGPEDHRFKDSVWYAEKTGEFVVNLATYPLREAVNMSSAPTSGDEFVLAGLDTLPSVKVKPPRVAASPVHLECTTLQVIDLPADDERIAYRMVLGQVVGVHIADEAIVDGRVAIDRLQPVSRLGYMEWGTVGEVFVQHRPDAGGRIKTPGG